MGSLTLKAKTWEKGGDACVEIRMMKVAARLRSRNNPGKGNSEYKGHRPAVAGNRRHGKQTSVAGAQEGRVGRGGGWSDRATAWKQW